MLANQDVGVSYQQVVDFFLPSLQRSEETIELITRLATVFRFLQYLIEKNDSNQQVVDLLQRVISVIPAPVCSNADEIYVCDFANTTDHLRQPQLALFALGSLLRLSHYVSRKPFLLSPLWKGISELTKKLGSAPQDLMQVAIKSLLDLINEGITSLPTVKDLNRQIYCIKVLAFLVSRLSTILSLGGDLHASLSESFLKACYFLRGIKMAVEDSDEGLQQGVSQVMTKTEKCLLSWLAKPQQDNVASLLTLLIETSARGMNKVVTASDLAFIQGRSLTILQVIERTTTSESQRPLQEVERLLELIEELLFDLFPRQWSSISSDICTLLPQSIKTIVTALVSCDHSLQMERISFHFLLVRWLSLSEVHPFTREIVTSILHLFAVEHCRYEEGCPFLSLLVKLSMDGRTSVALKTGISNCLGRLLQSQTLREKVKSFLLDGRISILNPSKRKRKLAQQSPPKMQISDVAAITRLVVDLPAYDAPLPVTKPSQFRQSVIQASMVATGLHSLIEIFFQCDKQQSVHDRRQITDLGVLVLRRIRTSIEKENRPSSAEVVRLCRILERCERMSTKTLSPLELERIRVLGAIGQVITEDTPSAQLEKLVKSFSTLLSNENNWLISAYAMTSFVRFASTIPAIHKRFLSECVPPKAQTLLKQRLQGRTDLSGQDIIRSLQARCARGLIPQRIRSKCLLKKPNNILLPLGSFVISMPTQEGRSALVIFPPGEDSIKDIDYFRNGDNSVTVQELHGTALQPDGSCRFVLREPSRA